MNIMDELRDLERVTDNICKTLDKAAEDEKRFCVDIQLKFEQMSWQVLKMKNDLTKINNYIGA